VRVEPDGADDPPLEIELLSVDEDEDLSCEIDEIGAVVVEILPLELECGSIDVVDLVLVCEIVTSVNADDDAADEDVMLELGDDETEPMEMLVLIRDVVVE
jgi:hypothetical protein